MKSIGIFIITLFIICNSMNAQRGYVRDAIENKYEDKYMNDSSSALKQWMYGNLMNVNVAPSYTFVQSMVLHTIIYKKNKVDKETDMDVYINSVKKTMAYHIREQDPKKEDMTVIMDMTQNAMITLNKKEMKGMAITMNAFMSKEAQEKLKENQNTTTNTNTDCKKTGATKIIQGYKCEEYTCTNVEKGTKVVMWICPTLFNQNIASSMFKSNYYGYSFPTVAGMVMECSFYKNEVLETKMNVTEFNKAANYTIVTSAYAINKM